MFKTGKELESIFSTEAAFYKLETDEKVHLCRSVAAIRRNGAWQESTDALFVLLNPGKCLPVEGEESISLASVEIDRLPMVPATPDNTMFQLMRLMERMGWNHVQIINLTDIRTAKFEEYKAGQQWMNRNSDSRHSIFSIDRYQELLDRLESAETVIAGWGTKPQILPAAKEANTILWEIAEVRGLRFRQHPLYYHPFPWLQTKCIMWLDDMEAQLKRVGEMV